MRLRSTTCSRRMNATWRFPRVYDFRVGYRAHRYHPGLGTRPDIRSGVASFRYCHACHLHYLFIDDARVPEGCPICALKRQYAR